jgi:hypothetical protein
MNDSIFPVLALIRSFKASSLKYASKRLEKEGKKVPPSTL